MRVPFPAARMMAAIWVINVPCHQMLADSSVARHGACMSPPFPFRIIGFDLDGTLVDSSLELAAALNHALAQNGRDPIAAASVKQLVGMGAKHMLKMALEQSGPINPEELDQLLPLLIDYYDSHLGTQCPVFPGLEAALDRLSAQGVRVAVVTTKYYNLAGKYLDGLGQCARICPGSGGWPAGAVKPSQRPAGARARARAPRRGAAQAEKAMNRWGL